VLRILHERSRNKIQFIVVKMISHRYCLSLSSSQSPFQSLVLYNICNAAGDTLTSSHMVHFIEQDSSGLQVRFS